MLNCKSICKKLIGIGILSLFVLVWSSAAMSAYAADAKWDATYWNNKNLTGDPVLERKESNLDHDWGDGSPSSGVVHKDNFSARWKRSVYFSAGTYRFTATMDDGMRVWVDDVLIIDSWGDSQVHLVSSDVYLNTGDHEVKVKYYEAGGQAVAKLNWTLVSGAAPTAIVNWQGEYFNNMNLSGAPAQVRDDANVNFNWGSGSPASGVNSDGFSVRWSRSLFFSSAGRYRFTVTSDDGVRLWVNNQQLVNAWQDHAPQTYSGEIDLPAGTLPIIVEYYEHTGGAQIQLTWVQVTAVSQPTPLPPTSSGTGTVQSARLNVRYGPGLQYGVITQLSYGQTVALAGYRDSNSGWVMINWNNSTAWVSAHPAYLSTNIIVSSLPIWQGSIPNSGGPTSGATGTVTNCYYLNVRTGPGATYGIIKAVPSGTIVSLLGRNTASSWAKVRLTDGTVGWMSASYLNKSVPMSSLPVAN